MVTHVLFWTHSLSPISVTGGVTHCEAMSSTHLEPRRPLCSATNSNGHRPPNRSTSAFLTIKTRAAGSLRLAAAATPSRHHQFIYSLQISWQVSKCAKLSHPWRECEEFFFFLTESLSVCLCKPAWKSLAGFCEKTDARLSPRRQSSAGHGSLTNTTPVPKDRV